MRPNDKSQSKAKNQIPICMHIPICCGFGLPLAMSGGSLYDRQNAQTRLFFSFFFFLSVVCSPEGFLVMSQQGAASYIQRDERLALPLGV